MDDTQSKRIEKYFQEREGIMKTKRNRLLQKMTAWICVFSFLCPALNVSADELDSMESKSLGLQSELDSLNGEILQISEEIADNEVEMETVNHNIIRAQEQLEIAKNNEDAYYEDMKVRIQYIYENSDASLLEMIFSAESLSELVNKVHFVQKLSEYDRGMFEALQDLRSTIEEEEKVINKLRPYLNRDGGDIELIDFKDGIVYVKMLGACAGCSMLDETLKDGVEQILMEEVPGVLGVQNILEGTEY